MSFSDISSAKKYASIAETAAAQAKLYANKLELAPNYAEQAATSATAAAASAQVAVNAEGVVNNLVVSASESATSAAESAALAGNAAAAAVGQCVRVVEGELIDPLPESSTRANSFLVFDSTGNATVLSKDDVAILDPEGKIPVSMIPAIAITQPFVVSSQAAMLALDAQVGDVAKRTDKGFSFILSAEPASTLSNWVQLNDDVLAQLGLSSGATQVGALDDVGGATTVQGALNLKATTASVTSTDAANRAWTNENFVDSTYKKLQTGNFATGFTITNQFQVVFYPTDGFWYRYLGTLSGGGLTLPAGSSPDSSWENINKQQMVSLRKINALSTASIAGYIGVNIDMPVSVTDSDNQGAIISANTTIRNDINNQNFIKTTKNQSALRVDGDNVTLIGLCGVGSAAADNSGTSEFITTRMAQAAGKTIKNLLIKGAKASKFTTGIHFSGVDGGQAIDCDFADMQYSPVTLGSSGGYAVLTDKASNIKVLNLKYVANAYGRHSVYVSCIGSNSDINVDGSYNITIEGANLDYTAVDLSLSDSGMVPIHIRRAKGVDVLSCNLRGSASLVSTSNDTGPAARIRVINSKAVDMVSAQNRASGFVVIGRSNIPYRTSDVEIRGNYSVMTQGAGQAVGNDQGAIFYGVDGLVLLDNHHIVDTGVCYNLVQCTDFVIDNIKDELQVSSNSTFKPVIYLDTCSGGTIGKIKTTRGATFSNGKSAIVGNLSSCSDITCNFYRYIEFTVTNGVVSLTDDAFDIIASGGITFGTSTITIQFRAHVTQQATVGCSIYSRTANNVSMYKSNIGTKSITISLINNSTGATQPTSSFTARIGVSFFA
ncbi:hypothetical protein SM003_003003 [Cronobacter malonaticus]|nr:hypothetical protein [Cronobacter malonaticus]